MSDKDGEGEMMGCAAEVQMRWTVDSYELMRNRYYLLPAALRHTVPSL